MNSGKSCAEVTVVQGDACTCTSTSSYIGVARPMLDVNAVSVLRSADFWGLGSGSGKLWHNGSGRAWQVIEPYSTGDVLRLLLDSAAGTLAVKKNSTLLGVAVTEGLTCDLCWAMCSFHMGDSVRIKAVDPAEF